MYFVFYAFGTMNMDIVCYIADQTFKVRLRQNPICELI
jgi:hypothetical protein